MHKSLVVAVFCFALALAFLQFSLAAERNIGCYLTGSYCSDGYIELMSASGMTNAHPGEAGEYSYKLCCGGSGYTESFGITKSGFYSTRLLSIKKGEYSSHGFANSVYDGSPVLLETDSYPVSCSAYTGNCKSGSCVLRLSSETNAHIASCSSNYSIAICCDACSRSDSMQNVCENCYGKDAWLDSSRFEAGNSKCCGNSADEYLITTNSNTACCNKPDDFVYSDGKCGAAEDKAFIYGHISEEIVNRPDNYQPSENAKVTVVYKDNLSVVNYAVTDESGFYNITVPKGSYIVIATKLRYRPETTTEIEADDSVEVSLKLELTNDCQPDCTKNDGICHWECYDDPLGCGYNAELKNSDGDSVREICSDPVFGSSKLGWIKKFNSTHLVVCCNGIPYKSDNSTANLSLELQIPNLMSYSFPMNINGKLGLMHVLLWDNTSYNGELENGLG